MKNAFSEDLVSLSPLESKVLAKLNELGGGGTRDIYFGLKDKKKFALTSVAVILNRLYEKGLVERKMKSCRGGIKYLYSIKTDKTQFERSIIDSVVNKLISRFGNSAISYFNERFSKGKEKR